MTETAQPAPAPAEISIANPTSVMTPSAAESSVPDRISATEAGRVLSKFRASLKRVDEQRAAPETPAAPAQESAEAAAVSEQPPGEPEPTQEANPAEEALPPIEPPRSWTKESKEAFQALPREHQERIAEQERTRELDLRKGHNEVAEQRKAAEAEAKAMAEARGKYEAALPQLLNHLTNDPQWADIKTMADVERLAQEDWPRAVQWQIHQQKVAAVHAEIQQAQTRQAQEQSEKWTHFAKREDELFLERAPELKDSAKAAKMREAAVSMLKQTGYSEDELGKLWESPALRDHRMQLLIYKAAQFDEAKKNVLNAVKKPLPPVVRPGVAQPNRGQAEIVKDLDAKIDRTSGMNQLRAAADLIKARRQSR
jgi:hypothetical protein